MSARLSVQNQKVNTEYRIKKITYSKKLKNLKEKDKIVIRKGW